MVVREFDRAAPGYRRQKQRRDNAQACEGRLCLSAEHFQDIALWFAPVVY
jgi:hypothetical protein